MSTAARQARLLAEAGSLLYGARWQSPLARAAGLPQSLLSMVVAGERPLTDDARAKVVAALNNEIKRLRETIGKLEKLKLEIEQ